MIDGRDPSGAGFGEALPDPPAPPTRVMRPAMVRTGLLVYVPVTLLASAWIIVRLRPAGFAHLLVGSLPLRDAALGVGVGLMVVGISRVLAATWSVARRAEQVLGEAIGPLSAAQCVALAVMSGVGEELLFRGALQPVLGLAVTSLAFGLAHVPMRRELLAWPVFAAAMGLLLGTMFDDTGALLAPILAHVTVNALNLGFICRRGEPAGSPGRRE